MGSGPCGSRPAHSQSASCRMTFKGDGIGRGGWDGGGRMGDNGS